MIFGDLDRGRPNDERGFIHKKLLGAVSKVAGFLPIPGAGIIGGIAGTLAGNAASKQRGASLKFPNGVDFQQRLPAGRLGVHPQEQPFRCDPPMVRGPKGLCIAPTSPLGASRLFGEAVMGQYGAALVPGSLIIDRATCPRGTHLGSDGLCYNKSQITNKQRMWPAGRKPLLTGGDMRAISTAARAGRRMELATKRLQKMGMMKKPAARRGVPQGHVAQLEHATKSQH